MTDKVRVMVYDPESNVKKYELTPGASQQHRNHSPDGFNFGYEGSGPAQLALAILLDFSGLVPHPSLYQSFKVQFLARMHNPANIIKGEQIQEFINEHIGDRYMPPGEKP